MSSFTNILKFSRVRHWISVLLIIGLPTFLLSEENTLLEFSFSESSNPLSFAKNGQSAGLLPELVTALFDNIPGYELNPMAYPWNRAQMQVRKGTSDGFITYASKSRKEYALFSDQVMYQLDYGYLIYHKDNKNKAIIQNATSFEDIKNLIFVSQRGTAWEVDNIPPFIQRLFSMSEESILLNVLMRQAGDFLVMPPEEATYLARKNNLEDVLAIQKVDFIPNSLIPFRIGISKQRPDAAEIISLLNKYQTNDLFLKAKTNILANYR